RAGHVAAAEMPLAEDLLHARDVLFAGLALLGDTAPQHVHGAGYLLGALHAPAHVYALDAEPGKLRQVPHGVHVRQAQRMVVHTPAEAVLLAAGPAADAAAGAAAAVEGRERALPGPRRAEGVQHIDGQLHLRP